MCNRTFAASLVALVLIAWMFTPVEANARGGFRIGGHFGFKFGAHRFRGAFRQQRYGLLQYGLPGVGSGVAADNAGVVVKVNNQIARDGFDRPLQRVCRSEIHTVPSESGGSRDVTVTRCFKE